MRKLFALLVSSGLIWGAIGAAQAGPPVEVIKDAAGDAGSHFAEQSFGPANEQGFDIVGGSIARAKKDLVFAVTHDQMPAEGPPREFFRLLYHFNIDNPADADPAVEWRFTIKRFDLGKPDVVARTGVDRVGQTYEPLIRLEQCVDEETPAVTLVQCNPVAYLTGKFDAATKSVSWTVPMEQIGAVTGSIIGPGTSGAAASDCVVCWVPHYAERSLTPTTIIDSATFITTYTVPKK